MKLLLLAGLSALTMVAHAESNAVPAFAEFSPDSTAAPQKSKITAGLYSALIPGMGELYAEHYDVGRYFTTTEAFLWLGYAGMTIFGNSMNDDAAIFAAAHSGASTAGKTDQYLTDVGNWGNTALYNDKKARDGDYRLIYIGSGYQWQWDSDANRAHFKSLHLKANALLDNTKYVIAAIVVNHFASAIDAVLQVNKYNKGIRFSAIPKYEHGAWSTAVEIQVGL